MSILEAKDLHFTYPDGEGRRIILNHVNYQFEQGKFYAILGESGSGKTTFLSLLAGLDKPESGEISYEGTSIQKIGFEKYRRNDIAIVFQSYNLIPYLSAVENVLVATSATDNELPKNRKEYALELLEMVGIDRSKTKRRVTKLSGGEQQRVAIARALSTNVNVILADEPTGNLDEAMGEVIVGEFAKLAHEKNKCVIIVTHSKEVAKQSDIQLTLDSAQGTMKETITEKGTQ